MRGRLTAEQVLEIRALPKPKARGVGIDPNSLTALSARYGVSRTAISEARSGRKWGEQALARKPKEPRCRTERGVKTVRAHPLEPPLPDVEMRPVVGYEGLYAVTSDGRVWSFGGRCGRVGWRQPQLEGGYHKLLLTRADGSRFKTSVHRLVALAWVPNPRGCAQVNHINGVKSDNRAENLEWVTQAENVRHGWATGLYSAAKCSEHSQRTNASRAAKMSKLTPDQQRAVVAAYRAGGRTQASLAAEYGVSIFPIVRALKLHGSAQPEARNEPNPPIELTAPQRGETPACGACGLPSPHGHICAPCSESAR